MESVTRTIYAMYIQAVKLRNGIFNALPNSTLNEKFQGNLAPTPGTEVPALQYIAIGSGGHEVLIDNQGNETIREVYHKPRDGALYKHIPFIAREAGTVLPSPLSERYRLKETKFSNGILYDFYFLKKVENADTSEPTMINVYERDGTRIATVYEANSLVLNPSNVDLNTVPVPEQTKFLSVIDRIEFSLDFNEIQEIINAYQLYYASTESPVISEIAACSGVEQVLTDGNGNPYTEAVAAQVNYFINTYYVLQSFISETRQISSFIEVGGLELLADY